MASRRRLDAELVRRGLADSRTQAARLIEAGEVLVGGAPASKPARLVAPEEPIVLAGPPPRYVGRGGFKLEAALERFGLDPSGVTAFDAGSSTGGFTDCLLQAGAATVVALDVGRAQLHERLRRDDRVVVMEQTDIRRVTLGDLERVLGRAGGLADGGGLAARGGFDVVVADLSFISLRSVADALVALCRTGGDLVVLVKPQFEAGRAEVSKGRGVIRDPRVWRRALLEAMNAIEVHGAANMGVMVSPIRGADGNVEFLAHFRAGGPQRGGARVEADVDAAIAAAAPGRD